MNAAKWVGQPGFWLLSRLMSLWVRPAVLPEAPGELLDGGRARICYVLENGGLADRLALEQVCAAHGLPLPGQGLVYAGLEEPRAVVVLRRYTGFVSRRATPRISERLRRLVSAGAAGTGERLLLVPVSIFWGRAPDKEASWLKLLFAENWSIAGRTRKFFVTLVHGRATLVQFSEPLPLESLLAGAASADIAVRKCSRILRVHFRQRRAATLGPDLSHKRTLIGQVLMDPAVQRAIRTEAGDDGAVREAGIRKARDYAYEIAADISRPAIRVLDKLLATLWNRLYDGVRLGGIERLHAVVQGNEIVYVPCHRSHIDYLLLSYIVYHQGLSIPHVAAGVNLNLPVLGGILRRGGAFFLRRTFSGNRLYAAVFEAYLREIISRGFAIEYFIEGGRSRSGRLLEPKGGMLAMTVQSQVHGHKRPVVFVPVYFGYEKMVEGRSFVSELSGSEKRRESLVGLLRSLGKLRKNFGQVYVNVGEPIALDALLDEMHPTWRETSPDEERPPWMPAVVDRLGREIMLRINAAAAATPVSLLALVLLATPRQAMAEADLLRQLELCLELLKRFPYSETVMLPALSPRAMIAHGEQLGVLVRESDPLGDLILMREREAVLTTYFANNVLHLFAIPAAVACCFIDGNRIARSELTRLAKLIYPYLASELFLRWTEDEIEAVTRRAVETLIGLGLLEETDDGAGLRRPPAGSDTRFRLLELGQMLVPALQRYYVTIALLGKYGSGSLTQASLETACALSARRLSIMYGLRSPDFFERSLFRNFIREMRRREVLWKDEAGRLCFSDRLTDAGRDAKLILGEQLRHSILAVTAAELPENAD